MRFMEGMRRGLASTGGASLNKKETSMPGNIFYIIGVVVVVLFILGFLGLR